MPLPSENTLTASNWFKFRLFYPSFLLSASPSPLPGRRGKERPAAPYRGAALTAPSLAALSTCACPCRPRDLSRCRTPFHPLRPCAPPSRHGPRLGALAHRPAAAAIVPARQVASAAAMRSPSGPSAPTRGARGPRSRRPPHRWLAALLVRRVTGTGCRGRAAAECQGGRGEQQGGDSGKAARAPGARWH